MSTKSHTKDRLVFVFFNVISKMWLLGLVNCFTGCLLWSVGWELEDWNPSVHFQNPRLMFYTCTLKNVWDIWWLGGWEGVKACRFYSCKDIHWCFKTCILLPISVTFYIWLSYQIFVGNNWGRFWLSIWLLVLEHESLSENMAWFAGTMLVQWLWSLELHVGYSIFVGYPRSMCSSVFTPAPYLCASLFARSPKASVEQGVFPIDIEKVFFLFFCVFGRSIVCMHVTPWHQH